MGECAAAPLRVGVLGTASIARKNARALARSGECELIAVASRSLARAQAWAEPLSLWFGGKAPRALGSYEELLALPELDAVYVPLPTSAHMVWVARAAAARKHVLLEKPVALSAQQFERMLDECREAGVRLMDGTMFVHHPRHHALLQLLASDDAPIGGYPTRITSNFSFRGDENFFKSNIRTSADADSLGCIGDLGWYCIRLALTVFGWQKPTAVRAIVNRHVGGDGGVPTDVDAQITFGSTPSGESRVLKFHASFHHTFRQTFEIETTGDRLISCGDFVLPKSELGAEPLVLRTSLKLVDLDTRVNTIDERIDVGPACQESLMWDAFAVGCREGLSGGSMDWEIAALRTQAVCDAVMAALKLDGAVMDLGTMPGWTE